MSHDKYTMFRNRLHKVLMHRRKVAKKQGVSCYRLYDLDLPEFPLAIDLYEDHVHVSEYRRNHTLTESEHAAWLDGSTAVIAEVLQVPRERVHVKERAPIADRKEQYGHFANTGERHVVHENGLKFYVNLTDYLDTGLFLDHRETRRLVGELSRGKRMLNLFGYTGTASVHAGKGGAVSTTTVDMSATYCAWARRNLELNGLRGPQHQVIEAECRSFMERELRRYGLIFLDPPTFSNSKRMTGTLDVQRDHPALIRAAVRLLERGGVLIFSTNLRRFRLDREALADLEIEDLSAATIPKDFARSPKIHRCYKITVPR